MVRKMSDDEKTETEKLIELQNYFNRIRKSRNKRTLQEPTTDYDYLNQELIDLMDTYVLQFESINPKQQQITSDYANDLKNQLANKTIAEVKDITDFEQLGSEDPHKEIIFTDGSRISLPLSMIQKASIKEQQRKDYMTRVDINQDGRLSPIELQQGQSPSPIREKQLSNAQIQTNQELQTVDRANPLREDQILNAKFDPTEENTLFSDLQLQQKYSPQIDNITDGIYSYELVDGEPTKITNLNTGKIINEITPEAKKIILDQFRAIKGQESPSTTPNSTSPTPPLSPQIESSVPVSQPYDMRQDIQPSFDMTAYEETGLYDIRQDVSLEDLSETINKDDPSKLKKLGEKVKKGYQGLTKEQKAMGLLMGLDVGLEAVNYLGPARKEARDRIKILEDRRERGQLGVDEIQDAETMKYMTRPVRAMAEESEREQQAVMAGMGETRSAADLRRLRESRDAQMTDALSRAGQEVARQQMARKEAEKRELNQLQAYQQENLRNLTNRISGSVAQMAGTFGANVAAEADLQKELSPDTIDKYTKIIMDSDPSLTPEEARRMATDYGMGRAKKKVDYAQFLSGVRNPSF